jgi:hypothetical protein
VRRALWAVALAAACRSAPAPQKPVPVAVAAPAPSPAVREDDPLALEDAALRSVDPSELLLKAARARRARMEPSLRAAGSAQDPADALAAAAQDALACAADAHRSWTGQFPAAAAQLDGTRPAAEIYAQVGAPAAEALYLEAVCSAAWARTQGFTQLIDRREELSQELRRVAELAPDLDGAGAERELGALLAALPSYAGGDLTEARKHLDAAVRRAPDDPRNHLLLARTVAVKAQDRALFEQELQAVAAGRDPAAAAEAASLLSRADDLFGPAQAAQPTPGGSGEKK